MVRAFLFTGTRQALLVDSTNGSGDLAGAVRTLTDRPVMLVNTHADKDHIGCNHQFPAAWMHPAEFAYYAETCGAGSAPPAPLQDGETIDLGGRSFQVVLVPGHTYGSIALLDRENRILVCGDTVSTGPVFLFGRARNLDAYEVSLKRLLDLGGAFDTIYPSHGEFPVGRSQLENQLRCAQRLRRGELEPQEPLLPIPAKMFCSDGAGFYYRPDPGDP